MEERALLSLAFGPPVATPGVPGQATNGVAVGDFNGDGRLDAAVTDVDNTVSVLTGDGTGTFRVAAVYPTGPSPKGVVAADLNGDGRLDLAVANRGILSGGAVSVLLGNGDGTFRPAPSLSAGAGPEAVAAGDFNRDGRADLVVANGDDATVSVLLGNGNGTFQPPRSFGAGAAFAGANPFPQSVAVGDLNRDGNLDVSVANFNGGVSVLLGNSDGTLRPAVDYNTGSGSPISVAVADLNGDQNPDLAVANTGRAVSVLLGRGDGTLQPPAVYATGDDTFSVAVGDFNGDGSPDLAVADNGFFDNQQQPVRSAPGDVRVLQGNGDGTFQAAVGLAAGVNPTAVAVGDFDGNGVADLVVTDSGLSAVTVLLSQSQTPNQRFVAQLYRDLLGREADAGGLAHFAGLFDQGTVSRAQVAVGIEHSPEYEALAVRRVYRQFLRREAEPAGLDAAVRFLSRGGTLAQLEAGVLGSPEYFLTRGGGTNAGFLGAVYSDLLQRAVAPVGFAEFGRLLAGGAARAQVAAAVFASTEYQQDAVAGVYLTFLHRPAEDAGLGNWVAALRRGASAEDVQAAIAGSDEFFRRL